MAKESVFNAGKGPEEAYGVLDFKQQDSGQQNGPAPLRPGQVPEEQYPVNFQTIHEPKNPQHVTRHLMLVDHQNSDPFGARQDFLTQK